MDNTPKVNKSLYNIQQDYVDLMDLLEENGGEITEEINELLIQNEDDFKRKAEGYIAIINEKKAHAMLIDDEIKRLQHRKKMTLNSAEHLNNVLLNALKLYGVADKRGVLRFEVGTHKLSTRNSSSATVYGESDLVSKLIGTIRTVEVDDEASVKLISELIAGNLDIGYEIPTDEEPGDIDSANQEPDKKLNAEEIAFLESVPEYSMKLNVPLKQMIAIMDAIGDIVPNSHLDVTLDCKLPKAEVSRVIKTSAGIRIAGMETKQSLSIR